MVVTVAMSEQWLLSDWWKTLRTDAIVASVLLCMILLLAAVLFLQFRFRMKTERTLREREAHYRLLANNIADIIILIDARSLIRYVSQSVEPVLGLRPEELLGKSCFDMIHPEDRESVKSATAQLSGIDTVSTVVFRTWRADGTLAWVESKFKLAAQPNDPAQTEFLCVIGDVTERKRMEDELTQLNRRLTQLAATDGLTGLTNRRTFDGFLLRQFEVCDEIRYCCSISTISRATTTPMDTRPATVACRPSQRRSATRSRPRRACRPVMAARNSRSCCRTPATPPP